MLVDLSIRNFAIIEAVDIRFRPGLNVLTGETGAGKSILIDALGAVLGDRVNTDMVRAGARTAAIDATFDLHCIENRERLTAFMEELQIEENDGLLVLSREIHSGGRSTARLNGRPTTAAMLTQAGSLLVDVHGQSEHLSLLRPAAQLDLLDRFAKLILVREAFASRLAALRETRSLLQQTLTGARERMQRVDLLRFQIEEIASARLRADEEFELDVERARLANADRLARDAAAAYVALAGGDDFDTHRGAVSSLKVAAQMLADLTTIDASTAPIPERAHELLYLLEDLAADVRDYRDAVEADPARLEEVEDRLGLLRQLKRKYGADIAEILEYARAAEAELEQLTGSESNAEVLAIRERELAEAVGVLAGELSAKRAEAATTLAAEVESAVARLNMGAAEFAVAMHRDADPGGIPVLHDGCFVERYAVDATGVDNVAFMIAPNSGEGLKPLSRIASGGETARLMLAMKSILSEVDQTPTLVFDEIDVGVGGRSGQVVGEMLWALTAQHQVIAITHLPQIAAFADAHFQISKEERAGRVVSTIGELEGLPRIEELAAMLDGTPISESALQNARDMVERAAAAKPLSRGA